MRRILQVINYRQGIKVGIRNFLKKAVLKIVVKEIEKEKIMQELIEWLKNRKTYIVCISAILGAFGMFLSDEITLLQLIEAIFFAIGGITLRAGIAKSGKAKT